MEQIYVFNPIRLRNEEAFGFFKLVISLLPHLLKEAEPENPDVVSVEGGVSALSGSGEVINAMLEAPINAFETAVRAFDETLENSTADSAEAKACEELRDRLWRSNNAYLKAMTAHPNPELAAIAERLKAEFDKYGDVTYLPDYEEWFNALDTAENNYLVAVASRTDVRSEKEVGAVKRTRIEAETAYTHLVEVVNLLAKVEGDTAYLPFINRMNVLIAEQRSTLKARQTRASKAKEPVTKPIMPEEPTTENPVSPEA